MTLVPRAAARFLFQAAVICVLAACGGERMDSPKSPSQLAATTALLPAASYSDAVQQLYIAYFGRPADTGGLANFEAALSATGVGATINDLDAAYRTNASVKTLVDAFGTSAESAALYTGGTTQFVTAVYQNVFNRAPDTEGLQFWSSAIDGGGLSKGDAALSIMAGALVNTTAQGLIDAQIVRNKTAVATSFTATLNTDATKSSAYSGNAAAATARSMLATVTDTTDTTAFQPTIDATITTLVANAGPTFAQVQSIVTARCVPCHSVHPTQPGFNSAPMGIMLDTEAEIRANASRIYQYAVQSTFMPYGNATGMTTDERTLIGQWYTNGQK
jgi:hypothetical protein